MTHEDLCSLNEEQCYMLGRIIGRLADEKPEILHLLIRGIDDEVNKKGSTLPFVSFGSPLEHLWRHGVHTLNLSPQMFSPLINKPSGTGN